MTEDRINDILAYHCGRFDDEELLRNVREAAAAIAMAARREELDRCIAVCRRHGQIGPEAEAGARRFIELMQAGQ